MLLGDAGCEAEKCGYLKRGVSLRGKDQDTGRGRKF